MDSFARRGVTAQILVGDTADHASELAAKAVADGVDAVVAAGQVANPSRCKADTVGSRFAGLLMEKNFIRKFAKFYPEPTDTSF